jgi:hypothetical protein
MTSNTITIEGLRELEKAVTRTSLQIRTIRIAAERGDISPRVAARRLMHLGIIYTPPKPKA